MSGKNVRFATSKSDLFISCSSVFYESSSAYGDSSTSYYTRSRQPRISEVPSHLPPRGISSGLPDYSSYEKFELIVESDAEKENCQASDAPKMEKVASIPKVSGGTEFSALGSRARAHCISQPVKAPIQPAAVCSTPANRYLPKHGSCQLPDEKPKHVTSLTDIQATPIAAPVFTSFTSPHFVDGIGLEKLSLQDTPGYVGTFDHKGEIGMLDMARRHPSNSIASKVPAEAPLISRLSQFNVNDVSTCQTGKRSDALIKRVSRRLRIDNILLNQSYWELYDSGDSKATLMKLCRQTKYKRFPDVFTPYRRQHLNKIGEGCFGEVFSCPESVSANKNAEASPVEPMVAIKLVPLEGGTPFNGDTQKTFSELLSEVIVSKELTALSIGFTNRTEGFVQLKGVHLIQGCFPVYLVRAWERYDKEKRSDNDHPRIFPRNQIWLAIETIYSGQALEDNVPACPLARLSIVQQVAITLAAAEADLKFEHRDLHWGNVLIRSRLTMFGATRRAESLGCPWCQPTTSTSSAKAQDPGRSVVDEFTSTLAYRLENREYRVPTHGVSAVIIDFTLSRLEQNGDVVYVDLSADPGLFESQGDYQFDIYRLMKTDNDNQWSRFTPKSNIRWLHYLVHQLLLDHESMNSPTVEQHQSSTCSHSDAWQRLKDLYRQLNVRADWLPSSAYDLVTKHPIFSALIQMPT